MPSKQKQHKPLWWIQRTEKILFLAILAIFMLGYPGQNAYTLSLLDPTEGTLSRRRTPIEIPDVAPYPVNRTGNFPGSEITGTGVVILDVDSGIYLYKRNETVPFAPASTTKILTALVALESYELDDVVTVHTVITEGATMGLVEGERITVENLLYGALIQSGNDAAYALAEFYPGGVEKFIAAMNAKAASLHLTSSTFTNPIGFDDPGHRMTPVDLALLAKTALGNKTISKMVAIPQITVSDVTHSYFHPLSNVNQLLGKIPGVGGIKTGWTAEAGENLVTLVERGGHKVIIVLLKSADRFAETELLINWVFWNHEWVEYKPPEQ